VVAFSVARYPMATVVGLEEGRAAGAVTIAITDRPTSPLGTRADIVLVAGSGPLPFFQSLTAAVSVANALVTAVSVADPERSAATLERAEQVWDRRRTFYQEQHAAPPRS
jgi:DNA-binding MurR/RpiR family transcriptional regulator